MDLEIKNLITNDSIDFSSNEDYVIQELDFGQVKGKNNVTQYINLIGYSVESTAYEPRDIVIKGYVIDNLPQAKRLLNKLINPMQNLRIRKGNYEIEAKPDMSIKYGIGYEINNRLICQFVISATAYMPLFKFKKPKLYNEAKIKPVSLFSLRIPKKKGICFGYVPAVSINNINNIGDVETGFLIRFVAEKGSVSNPIVKNNKTGEYIKAAIEMSKGDVIEISTVSGEKFAKLIRGQTEIDIFKYITKQSAMGLILNVGVNDFSIEAEKNQTNMEVSIIYTPKWLEVQE